jgi:hypothetical protein
MEVVVDGVSGCSQCGVAVVSMARHIAWHQQMAAAVAGAELTRDELDYLRDEILDNHLSSK